MGSSKFLGASPISGKGGRTQLPRFCDSISKLSYDAATASAANAISVSVMLYESYQSIYYSTHSPLLCLVLKACNDFGAGEGDGGRIGAVGAAVSMTRLPSN